MDCDRACARPGAHRGLAEFPARWATAGDVLAMEAARTVLSDVGDRPGRRCGDHPPARASAGPQAGVPVLAVDPVAGGARVATQAAAWGWPVLLPRSGSPVLDHPW